MSHRFCLAAILFSVPFASVNADIVHSDDVIIQYSNCTGTDCVSGEVFGADTIRLKENNLRIHFLDTSSSSAFPNNDWRIVINDSINGGRNYFAVEDATAENLPFTIKAGAGANALLIDEGGKIGIGTDSPTTTLHVVSGNTPTLRLDQDGSQGFTPGAWNLSATESVFSVREDNSGPAQMRLDSNGNLSITGQLTTAADTYPDYVFDPHYQLMPMDELRTFIAEKRHLPNVPSADEIVKNGLNLTDMHVRLMEKVEELTLYTLQQQEMIDLLLRRLGTLEQARQKNP
ncbi:hypothetical protein F2Q65_08700 [Thiohalocapsa marina]|uniref:Uncharacterized protein n=1 Tax=Thiohalocapsa marina TaxID=424902 RepID=A0A5M8FMY1_9GAMM|nr:hypothetical protein [Thiohalocapsa marina]KAA6185350.1 hypothetical protein F2Q65_08700 [Thiohalocapsa marina]